MDNQSQHNDLINLMSHLILTKPIAVWRFLDNHGVRFKQKPNQKELTDTVIDLLSEAEPEVLEDFTNLLETHVEKKRHELEAIAESSYTGQEDEFLGAIAGAIGKVSGIASSVGSLFKRRSSSSSSSSSRSYAPPTPSASALKASMDRQMASMKAMQTAAMSRMNTALAAAKQDAENARREAERKEDERREAEQEAKEAAMEAAKKHNMTLLGVAILAVALVGGTIFLNKKSN